LFCCRRWLGAFNSPCFSKVQLAVLNALPLPALDGGQMAFLALEALRSGKKLDVRRQV
jgi:membrane-associated protease RseP (regulator of RpoE activity)